MKHFIEILMLASLIVFVSCSDNDENNNNVCNQTEEIDSTQTIVDDKATTQWPTVEEMMEEEYFPIGTKWTEVWEAYQILVDENGKTKGRDSIPRYYYVDYIVDENATDASMPSRHVSIKHQLEPAERRTNWMLYDVIRDEFFIEEKDGIVYHTYSGTYPYTFSAVR